MQIVKALVLSLMILVAAPVAHAQQPSQLDENKALVVEFYNKFINEKDIEGAIAMMGPTYTQHNARIPDGKEGFRQFFTVFKDRYPEARARIVRAFAEGDYVILHVHMVLEPGTRGNAVMDIFRLQDGKLVEHWDVVQPVPDNIPHSNTMF